jgi:hypothetical protein
MESIETPFIGNKKVDNNTAGQINSQAENINECIKRVFANIPLCDEKVIVDHLK